MRSKGFIIFTFIADAERTGGLNPLTWKKWLATNNVSRWQMGFTSASKGLILFFSAVPCHFSMSFYCFI